jgi:predicted Zn-dependent protease with MMP-like domain
VWSPLSFEAFEALVDDAIDQIPSPFAERLHTVAIVVEDEPLAEQVPPGRMLLGLYTGVPRTAYGADNAAVPSKIAIYRGPLTRAYPDRAALAAAVESTVFHEVAHHFGISDDRLRELASPRARPSV